MNFPKPPDIIFEKIRRKRDVLFWTGSQIADWYLKVGPKPAA